MIGIASLFFSSLCVHSSLLFVGLSTISLCMFLAFLCINYLSLSLSIFYINDLPFPISVYYIDYLLRSTYLLYQLSLLDFV